MQNRFRLGVERLENSRQIQKAGGKAQQIQAETVVVNNGFSVNDISALFQSLIPLAIQDYTKEAYKIAEERIGYFENKLMPRIIEIENALEMFADPAFQVLIKNAQRTAAISDRENDYDTLAELIVTHIKKGDNRKNRVGIRKAIEIVGMIDTDALCALTVAHVVNSYLPMQGNVKEGLEAFNRLFSKLIYEKLPDEIEWLEHLDILGAVRLSSFGHMKKFSEYYTDELDGYACIGIEKESENYIKAIELLKSVDVNVNILMDNPFLDGFVRIPVHNKKGIEDIPLVDATGIVRCPKKNEYDAFCKIWEMYKKDDELTNEVNRKFMEMWDSFDTLSTVRIWWESIPMAFSVTSVGKVLAHTNAKRCDHGIPDMI